MNATVQARADYRSRFGNFRYRVEIVDSTQVTTNAREYDITISGAVIEYESNEQDVYKPIIPSTCNFSLVCTTQAQIDFLREVAASAIGRYGVRVLRADNAGTPTATKWVGTLVSDQITFSDSLPQQVDLTATDDLGYLKDAPYLDTNGERHRNNDTFLQHILQALKNLRTRWYYDYDLLGFFNKELSYEDDLTPSEYVSASSSIGFLEESQCDNNMFYKDDDEELVINSYEVLEMICKYLGVSIYQSFEQDVTSFVMCSFATYQKKAQDGSGYTATGKVYRSNGAIALQSPLAKSSVDITNDASNKKRLAGGTFTYLQPYRKVTRTLKVHEDETLFTRVFKEGTAQGAAVRQFNELYHSDYHNFAANDEIRLRFVFSTQWPGIAASTLYANAGGAGSTPDAYKIGRVVIRVVIKLLNEDEDGNSLGDDQFAERVQSNGGEVPIYDTSYGFASYPQFYTNHIATDDIEFSTSSTHVSFTSEPFVVSQAQFLHVVRDFVLPPLPIATANGIKVKCEVDFLDHTGAVAQNSGTSLITNHSDPKVVMIMRAFNGFEPSNERKFTSINSGQSKKSFDTGTVFLNDGFAQSLGIVRYRKSDGSYKREETAFTSLMQSSNTYPSVKLIVGEMANFYGTHREMYEGTLIKMSDTGLNGIFSLTHVTAGGNTTVKYKATKLSVNTGIEETNVSLVEIARNTTSTTGFTDVISPGNPITNGDDVAVGIGDIGGIYNLRSTIAENVAPVQALLATAVAANRSSQTGANIATIDDNGVLQEIADGSNGHILSTNGSGVYSFGAQSFAYMLASHSFMASMGREDFYYYGSNFYGWDTFTVNSSSSSISTIDDQQAHNGIVVPLAFSRLVFKSTIRNDSNANDIDVTILKGARPNGSSSAITLTSLGTGSANNDAGVDLHYNCDIDITGLSVTAGELIFVVFKRADGGSVTTNVNVSYSLLAIT